MISLKKKQKNIFFSSKALWILFDIATVFNIWNGSNPFKVIH